MAYESYGSYQLIRRLATGGMAQIYLAKPQGLEGFTDYVVVKRILPHLAENEDFVRMFLDEARIAARLNHPNIVQIYDLGAQDDTYFIAMEHIDGEDLRRVSRRADKLNLPIPVPLVCRIMMDACAGLDHAHKKTDANGRSLGIVHRDISPQNIVVTFAGEVKVVDFGIAQAVDQATVTRSGVLKGKYSYMSPEQASAQPVDHRSDIFALGVVLYELLTGTRLFKRANDIQTLNAVIDCRVPPPSEVNTALSTDLDAVVLKALAKSPEGRYPDAGAFRGALGKWISDNQLTATPEALAEYMRKLYADRAESTGTPSGQGSASSRSSASGRQNGFRASPRVPDKHDVEVTAAGMVQPPYPIGRSELANAAYHPWDEPPAAGPSPPPLPTAGFKPHEATRTRAPSRVLAAVRPSRRSRVWIRRYGMALSIVGAFSVMALSAFLVLRARRPAASAGPPAVIFLRTDPPGATIWLDGKRIEGVATPAALTRVSPGPHRFELELAEHQRVSFSVVVPATGEVALPKQRLDRFGVPRSQPLPVAPFVALTLASEPSGAELFVNGVAQGRAPQTLQAAPGSQLEVRAELSGHAPAMRQVRASEQPQQTESLVLTAVPQAPRQAPRPSPALGRVRFVGRPGSQVTCNRVSRGRTPLEVQLPAGEHTCKFVHPTQGTVFRRVVVRPGQFVQVTLR
ncbi:MAG: serine/threonine-protein kinase [Myxococcaceae bacterium]